MRTNNSILFECGLSTYAYMCFGLVVMDMIYFSGSRCVGCHSLPDDLVQSCLRLARCYSGTTLYTPVSDYDEHVMVYNAIWIFTALLIVLLCVCGIGCICKKCK